MTKPVGRVRAKVTIGAVKTHGPNSPDVISGKFPEGHREEIAFDAPTQTVELSIEDARELLGDEIVDEWLKEGK